MYAAHTKATLINGPFRQSCKSVAALPWARIDYNLNVLPPTFQLSMPRSNNDTFFRSIRKI